MGVLLGRHQLSIRRAPASLLKPRLKLRKITDLQSFKCNNAMRAAQSHTDEALTKLAESQAHTDKRLDMLIDIVRDNRNVDSNV